MSVHNLITYHRFLQELGQESLPVSERYARLQYIITKADEYYYKNDNPLLADTEYDRLFAELKALESDHPEWVTPQSPTQRVFNAKRSELQTVKHMVPMLSLDNSYDAEDLLDWDKKNRESLPGDVFTYTVEPKYDGTGLSLVYNDQILTLAATRGDGIVGEDITHNVPAVPSIPYVLEDAEGLLFEVRGEVVIRKGDFNSINEKRAAEGLSVFANPRNAASGSLRMLDPSEVKKRHLHATLYHISFVQSDKIQFWQESHYAMIQQLDKWGFATPLQDMKLCTNIQEVIAYCAYMEEVRDTLPFEIDGMVVKVNETRYQERLGETSHHPRWAMAFKFKARQATSILENVDFQVGRTGVITPVAKIRPVALGGVTISSISLFNEENIMQKDIRIQDTVLLERAGDVIPYIVKSIPELRGADSRPVIFPTECPVCSHPLHKPLGEAAWRCINPNCEAQVIERIKHFVSKNAMDIRSLGESNVRRFYELGYLKVLTDIYRLPYDLIGRLEKFGSKSVDNLMAAIEKSKQQGLSRLIFALGIRYVGETTAKTLERHVKRTLFEIKDWSMEDLLRLDDVGPKVAQAVYDFFHDEENMALLVELQSLGLNLHKPEQASTAEGEQKLAGKTFLVTGTLVNYKRSVLEALIEGQGGKILSGVSSRLDYLVVGADAGSKLEKAKKLGTVQLLNEEGIISMLEE